jgi:hypothetical protein
LAIFLVVGKSRKATFERRNHVVSEAICNPYIEPLLYWLSGGHAWAQTDRGTITGTVTNDGRDGGATVTATRVDTGHHQVTVTSSGKYTIPPYRWESDITVN